MNSNRFLDKNMKELYFWKNRAIFLDFQIQNGGIRRNFAIWLFTFLLVYASVSKNLYRFDLWTVIDFEILTSKNRTLEKNERFFSIFKSKMAELKEILKSGFLIFLQYPQSSSNTVNCVICKGITFWDFYSPNMPFST